MTEDASTYLAGHSIHRIAIEDAWRVLDVGSGTYPLPRADVLLDLSVADNTHRSGQPLVALAGKPLVLGDVQQMPFKTASFGYIRASHVAEHVDDPRSFCRELKRVGRKGYIETPSKLCEILVGDPSHRWYVYRKRGSAGLIFEKIKNQRPLGRLGDLFYGIYYYDTPRARFTFSRVRSRLLHFILTSVSRTLHAAWRRAPNLMFTCFEWDGTFEIVVRE